MVTIIRVELSDGVRRALRKHLGQPGLATRRDVEAFVSGHIGSIIETIVAEQAVEERRAHDKRSTGHED